MNNKLQALLLTSILCLCSLSSLAQSFDSLKKTKSQETDSALSTYLDKNDSKGLASYLKSHPKAVNMASTTENKKISKTVSSSILKPLLHDAVARALVGKASPDMCSVILDAGADINILFDSKSPVYYIMDHIATHPKKDCGAAEQLLAIFYSRPEFDINMNCGAFPPPFAYLIRENFKYLGGGYSPDYISDKVVEMSLAEGAPVNTYNSDGSSLMLLANSSGSEYLKNLFLDSGIDINRKASDNGDDAVITAMKLNELETLMKLLKNYSIVLTASKVKTAVPQMDSNMYDFVAKECADNSHSYSDLFEFRKVFPKRKELVEQKYTAMARAEVNEANDYETITNCNKRYPDLYESIVAPKRKQIAAQEISAAHSITEVRLYEVRYADLPVNPLVQNKKDTFYQQDVQRLETSHQHAIESISRGSVYYDKADRQAAKDFKIYNDYYDPQNKLPLATALNTYYDNILFSENFTPHSYSKFSLFIPTINGEEYRRDKYALEDRKEKVKSLGFGLASNALIRELDQVKGKIENQWRKDYADYEADLKGTNRSSSRTYESSNNSNYSTSSNTSEETSSKATSSATITIRCYDNGSLNQASEFFFWLEKPGVTKNFHTKDGKCTISWDGDEKYRVIRIRRKSFFPGNEESWIIKDLSIENGGNYVFNVSMQDQND